jgi:hypothetical protein
MKEGRQVKLKVSIPGVQANSNAVYDFRYFDAFPAESGNLKKPSRWPEGPKWVPHAMGPLVAEGNKKGT